MNDTLAEHLNRPLAVGSRTIQNRLILAPLTQLGNVAFRELVAEYGGCGLMFSEMCSARRVPGENRGVSPCFRWRDPEAGSLVFQIVGNEPAEMARAALRIQSEGLFGVDLNFGCAAPAICRQNAGAALLREPARAAAIVSTVRRAVSIPVTVKFRTGWGPDPGPAVDLARRFEDAGADALTFHPRVAPDRRTRPARWAVIGKIKDAVSIPVFGNGDVFSESDCLEMLRTTGCDGVAVGRMAVAAPWLFAGWTGSRPMDPAPHRDAAFRLITLLGVHYDPQRALARIKKFALYFSANFRYGHTLYSGIRNAPDMAAVARAMFRFFQEPPELCARPNQNFFS